MASDGSFAWHDHRTHWMNRTRPPGAEPGDQVIEAEIQIFVDGEDVRLTAVSFLQPSPSRLPLVLGVIAGALLAAATARWHRRLVVPCVVLAAGAATAMGVWATTSVPPETGPDLRLWALPGVALVSAVAAWFVPSRGRAVIVRHGLVVLAGAELALWAWFRQDALLAAIIPTDAPGWLDRFVIVAVAVTALATVVVSGRDLVRPQPATIRRRRWGNG